MSGRPDACDRCLRRSWLVARLAGHIERATADAPGRRSPQLLALPDDELARALAGAQGPALAAEAAARDAGVLRGRARAGGGWCCCRHHDLYPEGLAGWEQAPATLFGRGDPALLERLRPAACVTVVGARRASAHGREVARLLGSQLAAAGLVVVSGLALGIDSWAHRGALEAGGLTAAVMGCGPDVTHPPSARRLRGRIGERGLILAELPPGTTPRRWTFPARNRIMAALAATTVVVEARRRSGSLITATMAQDLGREVGAVPGAVGSSLAEGVNALLRDGAQVIRDAQDVLDSMLGAGAPQVRGEGEAIASELRTVLDLVEAGCAGADSIAREGRLDPAFVAASLVRLELRGYLRSDSAGVYQRTQLSPPGA